VGDAAQLTNQVPDDSVQLILTSPPFALTHKKPYGNVPARDYLQWFDQFVEGFWRVLTPTGSLVIHIGGSWNKGMPTRTVYHFELLLHLCQKFHLAQELYYHNPAAMPAPAAWVTVRRIRLKNGVDPVWWLSKTPFPKADNRRVLKEYSNAMRKLLTRKHLPTEQAPSGHTRTDRFLRDRGGAIPSNLISAANTRSNDRYLRECRKAGVTIHPARFPLALAQFFIRFLTDEGDTVLDPFAGSNTTGEAAERLGRRWLAFDIREEYVVGSRLRFARRVAQPVQIPLPL
jgi:site-specific DNA-methyltransferase (cytosine-N4-specific)